MALTLNSRLSELKLSGIRRFNQLARETPGCVSLTLGEPGEDTPAAVRARVTEDLAAGYTHYPPNNGYPWLREAIAGRECAGGIPAAIAAADNVIVTSGATEALFVALTLVLDPGDEVIVPTPAFSLYESIVTLQGGVVVPLDTGADGFQIRAAALGRCVSSRTKAIVLNSPNNPTGCVLDEESLDVVADVALAHGLFVICDDVYEQLVYVDGYRRFAAAYPGLADRTLVVNSFSKPWAMTGWRLGWLMCVEPLVREAAKIHQYAVSSVPAFVQHAAQEALAYDVAPMRESYRRRRDMTVAAVEGMDLPLTVPEGAFYAFPRIEGLGLTSDEFCERAIREAGVALVPGSCFGAEGYVRISYACSEDQLRDGLRRLAGFVDSLR